MSALDAAIRRARKRRQGMLLRSGITSVTMARAERHAWSGREDLVMPAELRWIALDMDAALRQRGRFPRFVMTPAISAYGARRPSNRPQARFAPMPVATLK